MAAMSARLLTCTFALRYPSFLVQNDQSAADLHSRIFAKHSVICEQHEQLHSE